MTEDIFTNKSEIRRQSARGNLLRTENSLIAPPLGRPVQVSADGQYRGGPLLLQLAKECLDLGQAEPAGLGHTQQCEHRSQQTHLRNTV